MIPDFRLSRREILRLLSAAGVSGILPIAAAAAEFPELAVFNRADAERLLAVSRTLFPHDVLDDSAYVKIVTALDQKAQTDPASGESIRAGLQKLPDNFATMPEASREAELRRIEATPFFQLTYNETLAGLYRNPKISSMFGNEGSSIEYGGFINRGFDDIDWLPNE